MKVYTVIGGYDYEGEDFKSLRLFDCWSAADAYREELHAEYDYSKIDTREVIMESLFSPQVEANLEALCKRLGC